MTESGSVAQENQVTSGWNTAAGILSALLTVCFVQLDFAIPRLGLSVPFPAIVFAFVLAVLLLRERWPPLPQINGLQLAFFATASLGILGLSRSEFGPALKEAAQLTLIVLVAPFVARRLQAYCGWKGILNAFAGSGLILLLLFATGITAKSPFRLSSAKAMAFIVISWPFIFSAANHLSRRLQIPLLLIAGALVGFSFEHGGFLVLWILVLMLCSLIQRDVPRRLAAGCGVAALLLSVPAHETVPAPWAQFVSDYPSYKTRAAIEVEAALRAPRYYPVGGGLGKYRETINDLRLYGESVPHPHDNKIERDSNIQYLLTCVEAGLPAAVMLIILIFGSAWTAFGLRDKNIASGTIACALVAAGAAGLLAVILSRGIGLWVGLLFGMADVPSRLQEPGKRLRRLAAVVITLTVVFVLMLLLNNSKPQQNQGSNINRQLRMLFFPQDKRLLMAPPVVLLADEFSDDTHTLLVEAESSATVTEPFVKVPVQDASGQEVLAIPLGAGKGHGRAVYNLNIEAAGEYALAARVWWEDGCSNSLAIDVGSQTILLSSDMFQSWHLLAARTTVQLLPGPLQVTIRSLEDGIRIDYFILRQLP